MPDLIHLETRVANIENHIEHIEVRIDQIYEMLSERHAVDERIAELRFPGTGETRERTKKESEQHQGGVGAASPVVAVINAGQTNSAGYRRIEI